MVDSINSGGAPQLKRAADDAAGAARLKGNKSAGTAVPASPVSGAPAGDTMEIKSAIVSVPQELKQPPIELALVTKLQEQIANGDYPIDLDAITDSLFESYLELNS